jgi:uncharacterized protein YbbC (DUF1343 family)
MEEAAKARIPFYVLDRPNPITGLHVEGPMLDGDKISFTGPYPLALRHGMTIGELAGLMNSTAVPKADLHVIQMTGWRRDQWFDSTGLPWINPSPNIRNLNAALLYAGVGMIEFSQNYSVGRGTDSPFEQIGADWIKGPDLERRLNALNLPGVRFYPVEFTPDSSNLKGKKVSGVRLVITGRGVLSSAQLGLAIASSLQKLYPGKIAFSVDKNLIGNEGVIRALTTGTDTSEPARNKLQEFLDIRQKFLLYN